MDTGRAAQEHPDPALDFFSEEFDAAKALTTPGLQPPMPDAPVLDYLAKCRTLLPPEMPESLANVAKEAGQKSGSEVCDSGQCKTHVRVHISSSYLQPEGLLHHTGNSPEA
jgi:hypothetical protein